jgi:hypothetical protein
LLEVKLLNGDHAGDIALIPRITLSPSLTGHESVIKLNRRQFPVQLAFAMTINKAQGQTVQRVGIDLRKPVFAHGQLYHLRKCQKFTLHYIVIQSSHFPPG